MVTISGANNNEPKFPIVLYLTRKQINELNEEIKDYKDKFPNDEINEINEYIILLLQTMEREIG